MIWIILSDIIAQKKLILLYIFTIVLSSVILGRELTLALIVSMSYKIVTATCMNDDLSGVKSLYFVMPIKRLYIVIEKYILYILFFMLGFFLAYNSGLIVSSHILPIYPIHVFFFLGLLFASFGLVIVSVYLVSYFRNGALASIKILRPVMLFLFAIVVFIAQVGKRNNFSLTEMIISAAKSGYLSSNIYIIGIAFTAVSLLVAIISFVLSLHFVNRN
ncbi:MAG: ABC-2 transporter permease [Clostridiaceae bacterium]|nr:ABC-2 transporter permease [Clostridiaceae bacterium]